MPSYRLNKVIKDLNISLSRAVEFLHTKDIHIDANPNAKIEDDVYNILVSEFQSDKKQKDASHDVVISKIPEKQTVKEEENITDISVEKEEPILIKAKAQELSGPKIIEKIDLNPKKIVKEKQSEDIGKEISKGKIEEKEISKEPEIKETNKTTIIPEEVVKAEVVNLPANEVEEEKENTSTSEIDINETQTHETQYQKLDGPKFTGEKVDLSQFNKPTPKTPQQKAAANDAQKNKRKRIQKDVNVKQDGNRPSGGQGGYQNQGGGYNKRPNTNFRERKPVVELSDEDVKNQIKETLEKLTGKGGKSKASKHRREKRETRREHEAEQNELERLDKTLKITEFITVSELASLMDVSPTDVISTCFSLGVMVTMNQRLDAETLTLVADEFGYDVQFVDAEIEESIQEEEDHPDDLIKRAPIVTVMGHVDHGKTSLLDYIRNANVIEGESGGITQHIGAYSVRLKNNEKITFLDTPGHEAFTAMRARGAQVTDIVIIVIAADDDVMPQTKEAISHAQAAGVPMIIALNKIDKPTANPEKIKEQLSQLNILVEDWGGKVQSQEISAKQGTGVFELLEKVLLEAEILELQANPNKSAQGVVVEASLDKGRGYVTTMLVQSGTMKVGDYILAGKNHGKVKAMLDERGHPIPYAKPSTPVTILGLDGAPTAGDKFKVFEDEREAKSLANKREQLQREQSIRTKKHITLDELGRRIALGDFKELNIILKGDVDGSVEALADSLQKLSNEEIHVNIILKGVGQITESDVLLASASDAIILGFNVRPNVTARDLADKEEVEIRNYSIIYDAINEVKEAMEGLLSPEIKEQVIGNVEIREIFKITKIGTVAGCMVLDGKITRNSKVRIIRDGVVIHSGELASLKRFKEDVKEVTKGYECGLNFKNYNNIEPLDLIEVYEEIEVKKKLK